MCSNKSYKMGNVAYSVQGTTLSNQIYNLIYFLTCSETNDVDDDKESYFLGKKKKVRDINDILTSNSQ